MIIKICIAEPIDFKNCVGRFVEGQLNISSWYDRLVKQVNPDCEFEAYKVSTYDGKSLYTYFCKSWTNSYYSHNSPRLKKYIEPSIRPVDNERAFYPYSFEVRDRISNDAVIVDLPLNVFYIHKHNNGCVNNNAIPGGLMMAHINNSMAYSVKKAGLRQEFIYMKGTSFPFLFNYKVPDYAESYYLGEDNGNYLVMNNRTLSIIGREGNTIDGPYTKMLNNGNKYYNEIINQGTGEVKEQQAIVFCSKSEIVVHVVSYDMITSKTRGKRMTFNLIESRDPWDFCV